MRARDVMTHQVITLRPHLPARTAASVLMSHGFSAAPVVDAEGHILGIATEADLIRGRVLPDDGVAVNSRPDTVEMLMTPNPEMMRPEDDLADVVSLMLESRIRSVPIVDDGRLVGIVSRRDVLQCVARGELSADEIRLSKTGRRRPVGADVTV